MLVDHLLKTKNKYQIKKKTTGYSRYVYSNEMDKTSFQHDMAYGDFKDFKENF